jgi:hypothetical protein
MNLKEKKTMNTNEIYPLTIAQDAVPGEFEQLLYWKLKEKPARIILIQLLAIPIFFLLGGIFSLLAIYVGKLPDTFSITPLKLAGLLASVLATIVLHELVHGFAMQRFGGRPQYGVLWKQLLFYAATPGYGYRRNSWILIALAPLILLSCLAILGMILFQGTNWVALFALCAVINGSGASGDLWMVSVVLRYPKNTYVVDEMDGIRVVMPKA